MVMLMLMVFSLAYVFVPQFRMLGDEVEKVRSEQDPIEQVRQRLLGNKWASEDELKKVDASVRGIVNEAAEFATIDPEPDPSELYTDVLRA